MILPSVTQVLKPYMKGLEWVKEEDLIRGQIRHSAYAATLLGVWASPVHNKDQGQLDSFRRWADKYVSRTVAVELHLSDPDNGYTGTLDFIGECPGYTGWGKLTLLDWKPPSTHGPTVRAQIAAYRELARKNRIKIERAGYLRPDPNGGIPKMEWVEAGSLDFAGFLAALSAWRYFNQ
jgi:hypothetical protein